MSDILAASDAGSGEGEGSGTRGGGSGEQKDKNRSLWGDALYVLIRNPVFWISTIMVLIILSMAFMPWLYAATPPIERGACDLLRARETPSAAHPFGFTLLGCDMWASVVWGTGKSVIVAILTTIGVVIIGVTLGTVAGYFGGFGDTVISRLTDIFFGLPFILGAIVFLALFPQRNELVITAVLILLGWTSLTRVMRGSVISTKQKDYVDASRAIGAGSFFIIRKHILVNSIAPVIVLATIGLGAYISVEATLTYLGVGYQRPTVSWGLLVNEGQGLALAGFPHLLVVPCLFIVVTVLSFILLGDVLRDAIDPRSR